MKEVTKKEFEKAVVGLEPMDTQVGDTTYNYRDPGTNQVVAAETRNPAKPFEDHKYYMA